MNNNMGAPIPRIQGKAEQRNDSSWTWWMTISIGDNPQPISMSWPDESPGFISKEVAIESLKEHANGAANVIAKEVYKTELTGILDLKRNQMVDKI